MKVVSDRKTREATEKQLKETELSRVKINKEDIDLLVSAENWFYCNLVSVSSINVDAWTVAEDWPTWNALRPTAGYAQQCVCE